MNQIELGLTRMREALHGPKVPPLAQFLNLWSLREGVLVGVNLDFSTVYEFESQNAFLMDPSKADLFCVQSRAFLNALPPDSTLQFVVSARKGDARALDEYRHLALREDSDALSKLIIGKKCEFMEGKFTQRRRHFLYVTSRMKNRKQLMSPLVPVYKVPLTEQAHSLHEERMREHSGLEQIVEERLRNMGMRIRKLDEQETLDLVFERLNPMRGRLLDLKRLSPLRTLREQCVLSPLKEEFDHVQIGDAYFRGVTLMRPPETAHSGNTQRLLNGLWPDCDLVLTLHALDTESALAELKLKNNITRALAFSAWTKNYEAEQKHQEIDELITEIRGSAQRLFTFSLSVLVREKGLRELHEKTSAATAAFHDFASAEATAADMRHFRHFLAAIPGHGALGDRDFYVQTDALAGLLPLTGSWRGSQEKRMLLETPLGEVLGLDPFDPDLPAKHGLILGTTGSGKSFTTNYLLSAYMAESPINHVVIIDVGGSYRKLAKAFEGEYMEVELSEKYGFNPFPKRDDIAPEGVFDDDAVAYLILLVSRMCLGENQTLSSQDKGLLEKAIKTAYGKKPDVLLSDVRARLMELAGEQKRAKEFADALELWTTGMYGRLFNKPGRLNVESRLVVFDLQNLENHPELQSVYFFVIRSIIWGKLLDRRLKKIIVVDEGWKFFNDQVGADLIEGLYRTARKFNGAVLSISQSPKDFLDTKAANAIIANSYIKYVLKLTKGHELLAQFDLNANEVEAVRQLQSKPGEFSDVLVRYGDRSVVARIEPCPLDYWICTTDARDRVKEDDLRARCPGLSEPELLLKLSEGS
ncbi:MAG: ATP-binding protein [Elusimicrobiota bacterium]|jgi:conjugal transfer ATP-binding protein TraC